MATKRFRCAVLLSGAIVSGVVGCSGGGGSNDDACTTLRIAGGQECSEPPPAVAIVASKTGYCSGTFITSRDVLTAAHCIPASGQEMAVVISGFSAKTTKARKHPLYSSFGFSPYDVAVVTIGEDAPVSPVPIEASVDVREGDTVVLYGFGLDQDGQDVVQRVKAGGEALKATHLDVHGVSSNSVETVSAGGDSCSGDSGGPLLLKGSNGQYGIVAVVRAGPNICEADSGYPSDNTNLQFDSVRDFVLDAAPRAQLN
jgi:secreted trypsin-like serine protease